MKIKNLSFIFLLVLSATVQADKTSRREKIIIKPKPNYIPKGVTIGSFILSPVLEIKSEYKDNIYSRKNEPKEDMIFHVAPALALQSNWNNHSLSVLANAHTLSYQNHSQEDQKNYLFAVDGRLDVQRNSFARAKFSYSRDTSPRYDPDNVGSDISPTQYRTLAGSIGYEHKINRIRLNLNNEMQQLNYFNSQSIAGSFIHNSDRDRLKTDPSFRIGYEINPHYEAFLKANYTLLDYNEPVDDFGLRRSSRSYKLAAGLALDLTGKLVGDVGVGYQARSYEDVKLKGIGGEVFLLGLKWSPTGLTTISPHFERSIGETAQMKASGSFDTTFLMRIDHELYRNLIFSAQTGYVSNKYVGNDRVDETYNAMLEAKYLINSNFYLSGHYQYTNRESNVYSASYENNSIYIALGSRL